MNIGFIPARCGSKSIPFKNIKIFYGKPLIYWSLLAAQESSKIDQIFLATDCSEIKSIVDSFGFSKVKVYDRDSKNANDKSSTESVMLEFISKNNFDDKDIFILIQATSPLTKTSDLDKALDQLKNEKSDSLLTCVRDKRFYWKNNEKPLNYDLMNRPRRQDFDGLLMENGAFYINSIGNIKKNKNRLSGKISIYEMDQSTSIELDEEEDWIIKEALMKKYLKINPKKQDIKLFLSDVDGTLTDAGMYYGEDGEKLKKFNTHDGKGFELLRIAGIKSGIITSENTEIVKNRAKKIKVDFVFQGVEHNGKLEIAKQLCKKENISLNQVAYIGDDLNCKEILEGVGLAGCPNNALKDIKSITNIIHLNKDGGDGAVREFIDLILEEQP